MKTSPNSFIAHQTPRSAESRNISPAPNRPGHSSLYFETAFLAERGVKLPPSAVQLPDRKYA